MISLIINDKGSISQIGFRRGGVAQLPLYPSCLVNRRTSGVEGCVLVDEEWRAWGETN
jgi:hypothetical protein